MSVIISMLKQLKLNEVTFKFFNSEYCVNFKSDDHMLLLLNFKKNYVYFLYLNKLIIKMIIKHHHFIF